MSSARFHRLVLVLCWSGIAALVVADLAGPDEQLSVSAHGCPGAPIKRPPPKPKGPNDPPDTANNTTGGTSNKSPALKPRGPNDPPDAANNTGGATNVRLGPNAPRPSVLPTKFFHKSPGLYTFKIDKGQRIKHADEVEAEKQLQLPINQIRVFGLPHDKRSEELDGFNRVLMAKGVNDAGMVGDTKELNCACCTMGALLGMTSGEVSRARQVKAGVAAPDSKRQAMTVWANPSGDPTKDTAAAADFDGQITPMKAMAQDFANRSNGLYRFVDKLALADQDINGTTIRMPQVRPEADLIEEMKTFPNGTRYAVYMKGDKPEESHWSYAERRNYAIIFRDYQQSMNVPADANRPFNKPAVPTEAFITEPAITVDQLPLGPAHGNRIFKSGAFFAIEPTTRGTLE